MDCTVAVCSTPTRRPNWSEPEKITLIDEVRKREERIIGRFKGSGTVKGSKIKEQAWEEVAETINTQSSSMKRTPEECRKQYANIKQRAKDKADAIRRPATGGGKRPASPDAPETLILEIMQDKPSLQGLSCGIDTEDMVETTPFVTIPLEEASVPEDSCSAAAKCAKSPVTVPVTIDGKGFLNMSKKKKRSIQDAELEVLKKEEEKFIAEINKLNQEAEYFKSKTNLLELKKIKLELEIEALKKKSCL